MLVDTSACSHSRIILDDTVSKINRVFTPDGEILTLLIGEEV